jgi:nucleotide-binding universal stress UspA family protein
VARGFLRDAGPRTRSQGPCDQDSDRSGHEKVGAHRPSAASVPRKATVDGASALDERPRVGCPRVVVGVDGSDGSQAALTQAAIVATRRGARLEVVSAVPVESPWTGSYLLDPSRLGAARTQTETRVRELVAETLRNPSVNGAGDAGRIAYDVVVVSGPPAEHLVRIAEGADLLVVSSRGRNSLSSTMLGSVALHCSTHALCPVLVVHPAGRHPDRSSAW